MGKRLIATALLIAALICLPGQAKQLNIENSVAKAQQVQAEAPRKEPTLHTEQEKALTEPEAITQKATAVNVQTANKPSEPEPQPITENEALMQQAGISQADWNATNYIVSKESSWCYKRKNGDHRPCASIPQPTLAEIGNKAYGLCQALPATKMASEGADYLTNPVTQLRWCHKYAQERYKGWSFALAFWQVNWWW